MYESLFTHDINEQKLRLISFTDNTTKDFHGVVTKIRDSNILEKFIRKKIPTGNNIVRDEFSGYEWIENINSEYIRYSYIHGRNDFGQEIQSTSHIESI